MRLLSAWVVRESHPGPRTPSTKRDVLFTPAVLPAPRPRPMPAAEGRPPHSLIRMAAAVAEEEELADAAHPAINDHENNDTIDNDDEAYEKVVGVHKPGSIVRVQLEHFLTYDKVDFRPGPRLNMVIGPNGTGKSTILNAICLGLGGTPKLLGRADDARAFIAHGHDRCRIDLTLQPLEGKDYHVFTRTIDRHRGSERGHGRGASEFFVDGQKVQASVIQSLVQTDYNISIDNLCTFLPQDKVGSFSAFNPQQLLVETEKTLTASQHLHKQHLDLIQSEAELQTGVQQVNHMQAKADKLQHETQGLQQEKERMKEREAAMEKRDLLSKRYLWLQVDALRIQAMELRVHKQEMKDQYRAAQSKVQPLQEREDTLEAQTKEFHQRHQTAEKHRQQAAQQVEKQHKKYSMHDDQMEGLVAELRSLDSQREQAQQQVTQQRERVASLAEQLATMKSLDVAQEEYQAKRAEQRTALKEYEQTKKVFSRWNKELQEIQDAARNAQQRLARLEDEQTARKERIFRNNPHLSKINDWLAQNADKFRRPVLGPIAAHVTCKNDRAARFLEQHVPNHVLKAFVVETKQDYDLLYNSVRKGLNLPINIIDLDGQTLDPEPRRPYGPEKMSRLKREFGITGFLDQMMKAPDPIVLALRKSARIQSVLVGVGDAVVGNDRFNDFVTAPDPELGQSGRQPAVVCCTDSNEHSCKLAFSISKYGNRDTNIRQDDTPPLSDRAMLASGINPRLKEQAKEALAKANEQLEELRPKLEQATKAKEECERTSQEIKAHTVQAKKYLENLSKFSSKHQAAQARLTELEQRMDVTADADEKRNKAQEIMNRCAHAIAALELHGKAQTQLLEYQIAAAGAQAAKHELSGLLRAAREAKLEMQQQYREIETKFQKAAQEFAKAKAELIKKRDYASLEAPIEDEQNNHLPLYDTLAALGVEDLVECEAAIEETERIANQYADNPDAIRQYDQKKAELEELQARLEDMAASKDSKITDIRRKADPWVSALERQIAKASVLFSKYMSEMQCTGEVALKRGPIDESDPNQIGNYKEWGIEIRVSFRADAKAQVLSAQVQSGGERSVSTILYLMALQNMMVSPFRCVDEINQGLDDRNERLVFRRIVENATKPPEGESWNHSGQYFLITPKLLPNLIDMENEGVTVLFVYNGPYNFDSPTDWDVSKLIEGAKQGSSSSSNKRILADRDNTDGEEDDDASPNSKKHKSRTRG